MTRTEAIEQSRGPLAMTEENYRKEVAGLKWKTRRIMNPQPPEDMPADCIHCDFYNPVKVDKHGEEYPGKEVYGAYDTFGEWGVAAKYQPGEIYYLPEPVQIKRIDEYGVAKVKHLWDDDINLFRVSSHNLASLSFRKGPKNWKQEGWKAPTTARFMLKSFAREFVRIKSVKIERLQDITPEDIWAEGINHDCTKRGSILYTWIELWNSIHGADAWSENPWVWVYEFERLEGAE